MAKDDKKSKNSNKKTKRKLVFEREETPKRARKQKQCVTCDDCQPSTSQDTNDKIVDPVKELVSLPSDIEDEFSEENGDSNNSAIVDVNRETDDEEMENVNSRKKFTNERSDLEHRNNDPTKYNVDVNALLEDEENEETLEEIYKKIQAKLAARKKEKLTKTKEVGKSLADKPKGKNSKFTEEMVDREISKIRRGNDILARGDEENRVARGSNSETTIYTIACRQEEVAKVVEPYQTNVNSSGELSQNLDSSEERVVEPTEMTNLGIIVGSPEQQDDPQPGTSGETERRQQLRFTHPSDLAEQREARDRAEELVRQAEQHKAEILRPTGESLNLSHSHSRELVPFTRVKEGRKIIQEGTVHNSNRVPQRGSNDLTCDNEHYMLAAHIDLPTIQRIQRGEYVPIERLIQRTEKGLSSIDDNRLELVHRNGHTYFVPAEERDQGTISNFRQWERAFRIYAGIYARANPHRAAEMYQFVTNIQSASNVYIWENVASYDRVFRRLMHDNPGRNWGLIFQQAWSLELRTPLPYLLSNPQGAQARRSNGNNGRGQRELCRKFNNTGKCSFGQSCKYDHKCAFCGKFGHGEIKCHKKLGKGKDNQRDHKEQKDSSK